MLLETILYYNNAIDGFIVYYGIQSSDTFRLCDKQLRSTKCCGNNLDGFKLKIADSVYCESCMTINLVK